MQIEGWESTPTRVLFPLGGAVHCYSPGLDCPHGRAIYRSLTLSAAAGEVMVQGDAECDQAAED